MFKKNIKNIKDSFANLLTGLGGDKDLRQYRRYQPNYIIDYATANYMYRDNWLFAKGVDAPIDDAGRAWYQFLNEDTEELEEYLKKLEFKTRFLFAAKWARVFGGATLVLVFDNDDMATPLNIETIRPNSLVNVLPLDRYNIVPDIICTDILSPNFGKPDTYTISRSSTPVHHSRIIKFVGTMTTMLDFEQNRFWGNSILQRVFEAISDSQEVSNSIANMVSESNIDVYKIEGLNELVASQDSDVVLDRIRIAHKMKSFINGIALDAQDGYEKKSNTFAQLPDIDDRFMQKVSGAFSIPVTRFLGISPAGMNATGESDMRNYYDSVEAMMENDWAEKLDYFFSIMEKVTGTQDIAYKFNPVHTPNVAEETEVDLKKAQMDVVYLNNGVIEVSDIQYQLAANETYNTIDADRAEETKKFEEMEEEEEKEKETDNDMEEEETSLNSGKTETETESNREQEEEQKDD